MLKAIDIMLIVIMENPPDFTKSRWFAEWPWRDNMDSLILRLCYDVRDTSDCYTCLLMLVGQVMIRLHTLDCKHWIVHNKLWPWAATVVSHFKIKRNIISVHLISILFPKCIYHRAQILFICIRLLFDISWSACIMSTIKRIKFKGLGPVACGIFYLGS